MIVFILVCFLVAGAYALPTPLGLACVAGLGVVWLATPVGKR